MKHLHIVSQYLPFLIVPFSNRFLIFKLYPYPHWYIPFLAWLICDWLSCKMWPCHIPCDISDFFICTKTSPIVYTIIFPTIIGDCRGIFLNLWWMWRSICQVSLQVLNRTTQANSYLLCHISYSFKSMVYFHILVLSPVCQSYSL